MPGVSIGQMKYEMPSCFGASGSVRAMRMPNLRVLRQRRPDLLAVHDPLVAVAHGAGRRATARSEPAPGSLKSWHQISSAGEQREQVALLLRLGAAVHDRRARPSRCRSCSTAGARRPRVSSSSMRIWWIGSASSPHGLRPVRRDVAGLGQLAAGRRRVGRPATRARRGGAGRRRPAARSPPRQRSPLLDRTVKTVGSTTVRTATEGDTMPGWNFADVWEVVAAAGPRRHRPGPGRPARHVARLRPAGQRHRPGAARRRRRGAGQGRAVPLQLPRVPRVGVRRLQGRPGPGQHELPLRRRRARLPVGQRRRGRRRVPRHLRRAHRGHPRPRAAGQARGSGSTTAAAPCPDWATPYEDAADGRHRPTPVQGPWGRDGDHLCMLYTGGTTGMPKGVMWRQDDLFRSLGRHASSRRAATPSPTSTDRRATRSHGARRRSACRRARSCTAPGCFTAAHRAVRRRLHRHAREPQPRRRRAARHRSSARGSTRSPSSATPSPSRCCARSTPRPGKWDLSSLVHDLQLGRDVQRGRRSRACSRHHPGDDDRRRLLVVRGARHGPVGVAARRARRTTAKFTLGENTKVITDDGRDVRARLGRDRPGGRRRLAAGRLLQGRGEVGGHVPHVRRQALLGARRLRHGRGRRLAHAARPRLGVHQHRRREGLPRGGRGGAQDARRRASTRSPSASPTRSSARPSPRSSSPRPAPTLDEADLIAHVKDKLAAYKAPKRVLADRHDRPGAQRQGRLQAAQGLGGRRAGGAAVVSRERAAAGAARRVPPRPRRHHHEGRAALRARVARRSPPPTRPCSATTATRSPACAPARRRSTTLMLELEGDIERLLLLQAPVAGELRYALAIIRIVPELERSGDLAEHIAKRAGSGLAAQLTPTARGMLERMGTRRRRAVAGRGRRLHRPRPDGRRARSRRPTTRSTTSTPPSPASSSPAALPASVAADATLVARFYERLGDHAVHIASRVARAVA